MPRIAEKLEFMTGSAVKICTKAGTGRKAGHKKPCFPAIFQKNRLEKEKPWPFNVILIRLLVSFGEKYAF
jgi:hypothetical protein